MATRYGIVFVRSEGVEDTAGRVVLGLSGTIGASRLRTEAKKRIGHLAGAVNLDGTFAVPDTQATRDALSAIEADGDGYLSLRFLPLSEVGIEEVEQEARASISDLIRLELEKLRDGKRMNRNVTEKIYDRILDLREVGVMGLDNLLEQAEGLISELNS